MQRTTNHPRSVSPTLDLSQVNQVYPERFAITNESHLNCYRCGRKITARPVFYMDGIFLRSPRCPSVPRS
jgi:hypothetical protein